MLPHNALRPVRGLDESQSPNDRYLTLAEVREGLARPDLSDEQAGAIRDGVCALADACLDVYLATRRRATSPTSR